MPTPCSTLSAPASTVTDGDPADEDTTTQAPPTWPPAITVVHPRKPFEVHLSARLRFARFHLDPECAGLENTPLEARGTRTFKGAYDLGTDLKGRACRMCALEPVLNAVLPTRRAKRSLVSFTSQQSPTSADANPLTYKWDEATDSGQDRLRRLADTLDLTLTFAPGCGLVAFGEVAAKGADILSTNLRTWVLEGPAEEANAEAVETLWTLLGDTKTATNAAGEHATLWKAAKLLSRP